MSSDYDSLYVIPSPVYDIRPAPLQFELNPNFSFGDLPAILNDSAFADFKRENPQAAAEIEGLAYDFAPIGSDLGLPGPNALGNLTESVEASESGGRGGSAGIQSGGIADFFKGLGADFKNLTGISGGDALKYAAMAAMAKLAYDDAKQAREEAKGAKLDVAGVRAVRGKDGGVSFRSAAQGGLMSMMDDVDVFTTAQRVMTDPEYQRKFEEYLMEYLGQEQGYAKGGVARYFAGGTDGMADEIPARIENQRPAALSDGEFVIPADVVSHLGNGNSTAGANRLYEMMDRIRHARTGTTKQGIEIDPNKFMLG